MPQIDVSNHQFILSKSNGASLQVVKLTVFEWQSFKLVDYANYTENFAGKKLG